MDAEVDWRSLLWRNLAWENDLDWDGNRHDQNCVGGHADVISAKATAAARGDNLSEVIRQSLERYVKRNATREGKP